METASVTQKIFHTAGTGVGRYRWRICTLLFFATTFNYIDRQVLGVLAPELQRAIVSIRKLNANAVSSPEIKCER